MDLAEFDAALRISQGFGPGPIGDVGALIEDREDAVHRREPFLEYR